MRSTNSPIVAAVVLILLALSAWWQGWPGVAVYIVGFLAGGLGTVINQKRAKAARMAFTREVSKKWEL